MEEAGGFRAKVRNMGVPLAWEWEEGANISRVKGKFWDTGNSRLFYLAKV